MKPRPYQRDGMDAVLAAHERGVRRQLVVMATGLGKTALVAMLAREMNARTLMLVHRVELLEQALGAFGRVWPEASRGRVHRNEVELGRHVTVAMVDTLSANEWKRARVAAGRPQLVICDEAHLAASPKKWKKVLDELGPDLMLGITATPGRPDGVEMRTLFDECTYQMTLLDGVQDGWLSYFDGDAANIDVDIDSVATRAGDFAKGELSKRMNTEAVRLQTLEAWKKHCPDRKSIVFCVDRAHGRELAQTFRDHGVPADVVDGTMDGAQRAAILDKLRAGELRAVMNCMVLTAGTDVREVDAIVWARPTQSQVLYIQGTGRGSRLIGEEPCLRESLSALSRTDADGTLRYVRHMDGPGQHRYLRLESGVWVPTPGKRNCYVLDLVKNSSRHSLVQLAAMGGRELLDPVERERRELGEVVAKREHPYQVQGDSTLGDVRKIDLLAPPKSGNLPWGETPYGWGVRLGSDRGGRPLGHIICRAIDAACPEAGWRVVHIEPRVGSAPIWEVLNPRDKKHPGGRPLTKEWAFGLAEETAKRLGSSRTPDGRFTGVDVTPSQPVELHLLLKEVEAAEAAAREELARKGITLHGAATERASERQIDHLRSLGVSIDDSQPLTSVQALAMTRRAYATGRRPGTRRATA